MTIYSHYLRSYCRALFIFISLLLIPLSSVAQTDDNGSDVEQHYTTILDSEKTLGQAWLKRFRSQVSIYNDTAVNEFTDNLLANLAQHIGLTRDDLSLILINNKTLNAFAVPGGIIGAHTGLYEYAETEGQFASVIAHELAHLSQRHYARNVAQQQGRTLTNMAALLAGLVLIAGNNGDAGLAAISSAQAATLDNRLSFSRLYEEEADNIGFSILEKAGYSVSAMPAMFEQMQKASRFNSNPPEFLLTHPLTPKRIASTKNRVLSLGKSVGFDESTFDYDLIRARVLLEKSETGREAINFFRAEVNGFSPSITASRYGLVLALIKDKQFDEARLKLEALRATLNDSQKQHPLLLIAEADILLGGSRGDKAHILIDKAIQNPENQPFIRTLKTQKSALYMAQRDFVNAVTSLQVLSEQYPNDAGVWYQLSEFAGLAGETLLLHQSRAEFFILFANFQSAKDQLDNVIKKFSDNELAVAQAEQRLKDIEVMIKDAKF